MVQGGCELEVTGTTDSGEGTVRTREMQGTAVARGKQEQSPVRSKWRNYKTVPHVIPTGVRIGPPAGQPI